jgi:hypothetical protein
MVGVIIQIPLICVETPSRFVSTPGFVEEYSPRTRIFRFRQPASGVVVFIFDIRTHILPLRTPCINRDGDGHSTTQTLTQPITT